MPRAVLICVLCAAAGCQKNFTGVVRADAGVKVQIFRAQPEWKPPECESGHWGWFSTSGASGTQFGQCRSARRALDDALTSGTVQAKPIAMTETAEDGAFAVTLPPGKYDVFASGVEGSGFALELEPNGAAADITLSNERISGEFDARLSVAAGVATVNVILPRPAIVWSKRVGLSQPFSFSALPRNTSLYVWAQSPGWRFRGLQPYTHHALNISGEKLRRVTGIVRLGGKPAPGARVRLRRDEQVTTTGADGRFVFTEAGCDDCTVDVELGEAKGTARDSSYRDGSVELEVELLGTTALTVLVVDERDQPVTDAEIHLSHELDTRPVETIDGGVFRATALLPGSYILGVEAPRRRETSFTFQLPHDGPVVVRLSSGVALEGRVFGADGGPLAEAEVRAGDSNATTDAEGKFTLYALEAGDDVRVSITHPQHVSWSRELEIPAREPLRADLQAGGYVALRVLRADGRPAHEAVGHLSGGADTVELHLLEHVLTDRDGRARLGPLPAGSYRVMAFGNRTHSNPVVVEIRAGADSPVELTLRPAKPRVEPLTVVDVEGPGDALANREAIAATQPALRKCLVGLRKAIRGELVVSGTVTTNTTNDADVAACVATAAKSWPTGLMVQLRVEHLPDSDD